MKVEQMRLVKIMGLTCLIISYCSFNEYFFVWSSNIISKDKTETFNIKELIQEQKVGMDFTVWKGKDKLSGTGYIEICQGKYKGKHWQDGSSYVEEEAFGITEGIILKYYPDFDHFKPNEIPKITGLEIAEAWNNAASQLLKSDSNELLSILNLEGEYGQFMFEKIQANILPIANMLKELSTLFRDYYAANEWVSVLGI
ncbi:MAG: hypothetical protein HXY48_14185 [Ignavibacteriaceae bacterium]|nr:hypothetical protein [Ignavibacteriaceae bacterium]